MDDDIKALLKSAGLGPDAVWQHKQSKQWIVYHWALEECAAKRGVTFDPPMIVTADPEKKLAVICVTGHLKDHAEWSFGEAAPYNTTQTYPFAMAEKRAKDRVILKLLNLHGRLYSEEEADTFKAIAPEPEQKPVKKPASPPGVSKFRAEHRAFVRDLNACSDADEYSILITRPETLALVRQCQTEFPRDWHGDGKDHHGLIGEIEQTAERFGLTPPSFKLDDPKPHTIPVPIHDDPKERWLPWARQFAGAVESCPVDQIDAWVAANEAPMATLKQVFPKTHDWVLGKIETARTSPLAA
jgi:hypothetical protein